MNISTTYKLIVNNKTTKIGALISNAMRLTLSSLLLTSSFFTNVHADTSVSSVNALSTTVQTTAQLNLHDNWNSLLNKHLISMNNGGTTEVDYAAFKHDQIKLQNYLEQLGKISRSEFDAWSKSKQLAFLINAYNAWTIELILTEYPDLKSIKDLGTLFKSPWDKEFIPLLGKTISLNDIEHGLIRGSDRYNEPRIHFAVNCASIGCPALRNEAYTEDKLEQQLTEQAERFLTDNSHNYIEGNTLYMSSIFKWYGDDFKKGFRGAKSIQSFVLLYSDALNLTKAQKLKLSKQDFTIKFLDYDWKLNDIH